MRTAEVRLGNGELVYLDLDDAALAARLGAQILQLVPREGLGPLLITLGRTAAGLTQDDLAGRVGLSRPSIARMETGVSRITKVRAELLGAHLGLDARLLVAA